MAIAPRRDLAVSFALAEALPLAVERGVAVKDTIAALCASVEGIDELVPIARACVGPFRVRRALALAEAVIAYAAASVNPPKGASR